MSTHPIAWAVVLVLGVASGSLAKDYYVAPRPGSGEGTASDPFGMDDLPKGRPGCRAMEVLQPGDTLYFRAGDYHLSGNPRRAGGFYALICPARSGTRDKPITIAAAPGEEVHLYDDGGNNPLLGTISRGDQGHDFTRFVGLTVHPGTSLPGIRVGHCEGVEVAYCRVVGKYYPTRDNHDGIRLDSARDTWVHHCEVTGVKGDGMNSAAVKLYFSVDSIFEDCFLHDCRTGFWDKKDGSRTTLRRSVVINCDPCVRGNETQGWEGDYSMNIEDCILQSAVQFNGVTRGSRIHDNLFFSHTIADATATSQTGLEIWNNVVISPRSRIRVLDLRRMGWAAPGSPRSPVAYLDNNLYTAEDAAPNIQYALGQYAPPFLKLEMRDMRGEGLERQSQVVTGGRAAVLLRDGSGVQPRWAKIGRDGDPPGPYDMVELLRRDRYGPEARPHDYAATLPTRPTATSAPAPSGRESSPSADRKPGR